MKIIKNLIIEDKRFIVKEHMKNQNKNLLYSNIAQLL